MSTSLRLYEMGNVLVEIADALETNGGDLTPELEEQLRLMEGAFESKVEATILYARSLEVSGAAAALEAKRLNELATSRTNAASRLKEYVKRELERVNRDKVETDRVYVRVQKNSKPAIHWTRELEELPARFVRVVQSVNTEEAYREYRATGGLPEGFVVQHNSHLRVR